MKNSIFFSVILLLGLFRSTAQQRNCGCDAALRYDIYKGETNFFSEMLLAREINMDNYKEILKSAGGGLSILGLKIGANGENVEKVREIYREYLFNRQTAQLVAKYESITTSAVSYDTYKACMQLCLKGKQKGLNAEIVHEDKNTVTLEFYYLGEGSAAPLQITYDNGITTDSMPVPNNEFRQVKIKRASNKQFSIRTSSRYYESISTLVKPYEEITAIMELSYKQIVSEPGPVIAYAVNTQNNDNQGCSFIDKLRADAIDQNLQKIITGLPAGGHVLFPDCVSDRRYRATRIIFKAVAPQGYKFRNHQMQCSGPDNACAFMNAVTYLDNNEQQIIHMQRAFSKPVYVSFRADTYKTTEQPGKIYSFSTSDNISFEVQTPYKDAFIRYKNLSVPLGQSNESLKLIEPTTSTENLLLFNYRIMN
jgi:hypothetical protein